MVCFIEFFSQFFFDVAFPMTEPASGELSPIPWLPVIKADFSGSAASLTLDMPLWDFNPFVNDFASNYVIFIHGYSPVTSKFISTSLA